MKNAQHWPLLSTLPAISTPFCNSRPNSTGEVDASCVSSQQRLQNVRLSVRTRGVVKPYCQDTAQHTFRMEAEQPNLFPWLRWASCVHVKGLFKMQSKSDLPALPSEVSQSPGCSGTLCTVCDPAGCDHTSARRSTFKREGAHQVTSPRAEEKYPQRNILVSILETSQRVFLLCIQKLP